MSLFERLFKPAWQSEDYQKRIKAVEKITDQRKLARIAREAPCGHTRGEAIGKLNGTHQTLFADIAKNDTDENARHAAVKKLEWQYQDLFAHIAKNDKDEEVRMAAIEKLYKHHQALFSDMARNARYNRLKSGMAAVKKLNDKALLVEVAKADTHYAIAEAAIKRLDGQDQSLLVDIAKNAKLESIASIALTRITDQSQIADIAKNAKSHKTSMAAFERLDETRKAAVQAAVQLLMQTALAREQTALASVAKSGDAKHSDYYERRNKENERKEAVEKLTDQTLIVDVAKNAEEASIREAAVKKLDHQQQALFEYIAKTDVAARVRVAAIGRLDGQYQELFMHMAINDQNQDVRFTAFGRVRVDDQNRTMLEQALVELAMTDDYFEVTYTSDEAMEKGQEGTERHAELGMAAVSLLTDQTLLAEIAKSAKSMNVREAAWKKMKELAREAQAATSREL